MKKSFWKVISLVLMTALIVVVASWASAQSSRKSKGKDDKKAELPEYAEQRGAGSVIVEGNKQRYVLTIGFRNGSEQDKYILYDSWNLAETKDVWFLKDPHTVRSKWARIPFDKK